MPEMTNVLLLVADALVYFVALAGLLRARDRFGLGPFFCALGVLHFLETYLASIFYVTLPLGIVTSPGSTILFTGKLMLLLLLYIREDASVVRQPIYGLLFGNVLVFVLGFVLRHHALAPLSGGRDADFAFLDEMGGLMVWGTAILFIDCIIIILLYERTRAWFGDQVFPRLLVSSVMVLTFDQVAFFSGLSLLTGAGLPVLIGGWIAKMGAVALYSVLGTIYLLHFERSLGRRAAPRLRDVFDTLTYRERYESLLARTGCDALTGTLDRHALETYGRRAVDSAAGAGRPTGAVADRHRSPQDRQRAVRPRGGRPASENDGARDHERGPPVGFHLSLWRRGIRRALRWAGRRRCAGARRTHPSCGDDGVRRRSGRQNHGIDRRRELSRRRRGL